MELRIGIIGSGLMGTHHAVTLAHDVSGATLVGVSRGLGQLPAELHSVPVYSDPHSLICDPAVDAVIVASPDNTHAELVHACLRIEKPVLCEKPLASTPEECLRIIAAEVAIGTQLVQVGFHRRFDPAYLAMKTALNDGRIGSALLLHCFHRNTSVPPNFTSEMMITNAAVHDFDVARWLIGQELSSVRVFKSRSRSSMRICDPQLLIVETEQGVLISIEVFMNATYGYDIGAELVGETGTIRLSDPANGGGRPAVVPRDFQERFSAAYRNQLQAWVDSIGSGNIAGASAWDGYVATKIASAGTEALETGMRSFISLAPRPDFYR